MTSLRCYQNGKEENGRPILSDVTLTECNSADLNCQGVIPECKYCMKGVGQEGFLGTCAGDSMAHLFNLPEDGCINANATKLGASLPMNIAEFLFATHVIEFSQLTRN